MVPSPDGRCLHWKSQFLGFTRCDAGQLHGALFRHLAVGGELVGELQFVQIGEAVAVVQRQRIVTLALDGHVLVHLFHLFQLGRHLAIARHNAVAAEVGIVGMVVEAASVVQVVVVFAIFAQALVHPVPDASANHPLAFKFNVVPVFLQVADGVAHGMGIFAQEEGSVLLALVLVLLYHTGHTGVHAAVHVGGSVHALIVYHAAVQCSNGLAPLNEVVTASAFVAHAPENDTGVVPVTQHHAFHTVEIGIAPVGVAAE